MTKELLGKKIKQERLRCNLSLAQLAVMVGTNSVKLSRFERGQDRLNAEQMNALKAALGLTDEDMSTPPERIVTYNSLHNERKEMYSQIRRKEKCDG